MSSGGQKNESFGLDELKQYYEIFFPSHLLEKWYSYGSTETFQRREFAFSTFEDQYLRHLAYSDASGFREGVIKDVPAKIHIGAVYNVPPPQHATVQVYKPVEKELMFDIDANDYDEVRVCSCKGTAAVCRICWGLLENAMRIIDRILREDFGFKSIIWIFSGRRGVHCWVCDESARKLNAEERTALVSYIAVDLTKGGANSGSTMQIDRDMHPSLYRSYKEVLQTYFENLVSKYNILEQRAILDKILSLTSPTIANEIRNKLEANAHIITTNEMKWESIKAIIETNQNGRKENLVADILFHFGYPRLDINVSKQWNHLLKAPMSVHPSTGMVCVPITASEISKTGLNFDPLHAPTLKQVCNEAEQVAAKYGIKLSEVISDRRYLKETSMAPYFQILTDFVNDLVVERRHDKSEKSSHMQY